MFGDEGRGEGEGLEVLAGWCESEEGFQREEREDSVEQVRREAAPYFWVHRRGV